MEFAFMDESGDPGAKGSKRIVMCLVCTSEVKKIGKIMRNTKKRLLEKNKTAKWLYKKGEIKFYSFPDEVLLIKTIKELSKVNFKVYYLFFDKKGKAFNTKFKESIMSYLFWHIFEQSDREKPQKVISDLDFFGKKPSYFSLVDYKNKHSKGLDKNGKEVIKVESKIAFKIISSEYYKQNKNKAGLYLIKIDPQNSRCSDELQAVDLICGSIFQFIENNNSTYLNIIKDHIILGNQLK